MEEVIGNFRWLGAHRAKACARYFVPTLIFTTGIAEDYYYFIFHIREMGLREVT